MPDNRMKVLLVENNELDIFFIKRMMKKTSLDLPVVRAKNGEEALDILRRELSDRNVVPSFVVLLDLHMPKMNGFEFLEILQSDPVLSQIDVYILSASQTGQDIAKASELDANDYILKPINAVQLKAVVEQDYADTEAESSFGITESLESSTGDEPITLDKLFHDLRAPIVNAKGFKLEISDAMVELKTILETSSQNLSEAQLAKVRELYHEDLQPCLSYLFDAVDTLEQRVQDFCTQK